MATNGSGPDVETIWKPVIFLTDVPFHHFLESAQSDASFNFREQSRVGSVPMWGNVLKVKQQTEKAQSVPVSAWVSRACCHQHFWPECKFKIQFLQIVSTWAYYSLFICPIPANSHIFWCVQLERTCNGCKYCWCEFTKGFKWLFLLVLWHSLSSVCCHAVSSQPLFPGDIHQGSKHCNLLQRKNRNKFLSQVKSLIAQLVTDKSF